ncbi:MAG: hypothetical protein H8D34_01790, partial [Chloroflexi bacterium]|nr:hypothetical protein [Chloroflexota bacterium]
MIKIQRHAQRNLFAPFRALFLALAFILIVGLACNTPSTESSNQTQIALNVQATQLAQNKTQTAEAEAAADIEAEQQQEADNQQDTLDTQATNDAQALTQVALDVRATIDAQPTNTPQPTNTHQPTDTPQTGGENQQNPQQPPSQEQPAFNELEFQSWMRSANILLFEDMAFLGYVQPALDAMSLSYVDVDDALGHFKTQLLSGGPGGQGWDLIISAKEAREQVSGEFYVYLNDALNAGSSIIIEEWNIDDIAAG